MTKELTQTLKSIEWDLEDLTETITIVEESPHRFKINPSEIKARKDFVADTKKEKETVKAEIGDGEVKRKLAEAKRGVGRAVRCGPGVAAIRRVAGQG